SKIRHHQENLIADNSKIGDGANVRMNQLCSRFSFTTKALSHVRISGEMRMHDLDDYGTVERDVEGVIDVRHSAFAHPVHDAVASSGDVAQGGDCGIGGLSVAIDYDR